MADIKGGRGPPHVNGGSVYSFWPPIFPGPLQTSPQRQLISRSQLYIRKLWTLKGKSGLRHWERRSIEAHTTDFGVYIFLLYFPMAGLGNGNIENRASMIKKRHTSGNEIRPRNVSATSIKNSNISKTRYWHLGVFFSCEVFI